jgi:predicted enzyme related to lactoylglutathione lyase
MANPFIHVELQTANVPAARDFYSQLFDWVLTEQQLGDVGDYTFIDAGNGTAGGMMPNSAAAPSQWIAYVGVDDVEQAAQHVAELGGKVLMPITEVPAMGRFTIISDPTGGVLGLWQSAPSRRPAAAKKSAKKAGKKVAKKTAKKSPARKKAGRR